MKAKLLGATLAVAAAPFAFAQSVDWKANYEAATEAARAENKLVMVVFSTEWCGFCQQLKDVTFADEAVAKHLNDNVISLEVDAEKEGQDLAEKYGVQGFPTIKLLDAEGNSWGTIVGYSGPQAYMATLDRFVRPYSVYEEAKARAESGEATSEDYSNLALAYVNRGLIAEANRYLRSAEEAGAEGPYFEAAIAIADHYRDNQQFDLAIPMYQKVANSTDSETDKAHSWLMMAISYYELEDKEKAIEYAEKVLAMEAELRSEERV